MEKPTSWKDDPECGHLVAAANQTHYCTYTRTPRLLTLQRVSGEHPEELVAILALQAIELWLKVVKNDVRAALAELASSRSKTQQLTKLLSRASTLVRLLDRHSDIAESILIHDLGLSLHLSGPLDDVGSQQLREAEGLAGQLASSLEATGDRVSPHRQAGQDFTGRFRQWSTRYQGLLADLFERDRPSGPSLDEYLALEQLLDLFDGAKGDWAPTGESPERLRAVERMSPDELMFIVVHQVFELWFRAMMHELDAVLVKLMASPADIAQASARLRRVVRIQKLLVDMIHVPATMLPMDFLQFRDETKIVDGVVLARGLSPASGTESYQFRELEIIAGLRQSVAYTEFLHGNQQMHIRFLTPRQEERLRQPSLAEAFMRLVDSRGVPDVARIFRPADEENEHADLAELADLLLEFDEFFHLWRVNHLTMVQSMIGRKSGTGFLGPEYLRETVGMGMQGEDDRLLLTPQMRPRFFEELWEVRTRLQSGGGG
jgi:tryptophan 2,3-dioxygenase